ncbi:MAG: glutathione S-transferase family protein [Pseudomonadota bacterium]
MQIKHIKLYHFPNSRSARVKWLLHELIGDGFEVKEMALFEGEHYQPDALARNPNHGVPVLELTLEDDSLFTMIESGAMVSLLADIYPERQLAPAVGAFSTARADYLQMLHFGASWVDMMLWQLRLHTDLLPETERDDHTIARYKTKFADEVEPQLAMRLAEGGYISGDRFTAADCVMGQNVRWARVYQLCSDEVFTAYLRRLAERPAYQSAFDEK